MVIKSIGTVSCNIYCNFTNYGSALQTWALHQAVKKIGHGEYQPVLVDYCPDSLADKDPLNPFANMLDKDEESRLMCEQSLPAIRENYVKFERFFKEHFIRTLKKYTSENFCDSVELEKLDGFICGSDTIFCINEFGGFDDGFYAEYPCMKNGYTVAYAASFGDAQLTEEDKVVLNDRLQNFKAIGLRERSLLTYVQQHVHVPVKHVVDPTLLLRDSDYNCITAPKQEKEKYMLLYVRRYNAEMEAYAERLAAEHGWKLVEISLRAGNAKKPGRRMFYEAGIEEFLSLVRYAEFVVTNSFHGAIFSVQYRRPMRIFSRKLCSAKMMELCRLFGMSEQMEIGARSGESIKAEYDRIHSRIEAFRKDSFDFLEHALLGCSGAEFQKKGRDGS